MMHSPHRSAPATRGAAWVAARSGVGRSTNSHGDRAGDARGRGFARPNLRLDCLFESWRQIAPVAGSWAVEEPGEAVALEPLPPAEQCRPAAAAEPARPCD